MNKLVILKIDFFILFSSLDRVSWSRMIFRSFDFDGGSIETSCQVFVMGM
jgi:hypothetical protein